MTSDPVTEQTRIGTDYPRTHYSPILLFTAPPSVLQDDLWHLGGFLDRRSMYEFQGREAANHTSGGNWEQLFTLAMFKGNPKDILLQAKDAGMLNDWLVALAPSGISHDNCSHQFNSIKFIYLFVP